jgi:phosphatidylcholine synthase
MANQQGEAGGRERLRAWSIHILTAIGMVPGLMALAAIFENDAPLALIWLGIALAVDSLDGPLARRYRVTEVLPRIDGAILDHVVDYTTYTLIPAIFLYRFGLVPAGFELPAAGFIMVVSLYCFANKDMKTGDNFFSGFPATWNVAVLYFYILNSDPILNLIVVLVCGVLIFVPMKFVHPFRVRLLRPVTIPLTLVWAALAVHLVLESRGAAEAATASPTAYWVFIVVSLYFLALSVWRSLRGRLG